VPEAKLALWPVACTNMIVGQNKLPRQIDDQPKRKVGHVGGQNIRCIGNAITALARRVQVDLVVTDTIDRNDFQLGQLSRKLGRNADMPARHHTADSIRMGFQEARLVRRLKPTMHGIVLGKIRFECGHQRA
jgi:hypothetical protein